MGYPLNPSGPGLPFHLAPMALYASAQPVTSICASGLGNDCVVVATGQDGMGRVWKLVGGAWACNMVLSGHVREVTGLAISGGHLWSSSVDCQIRIWDMGQGLCKHVITAKGGGGGDGHGGPVTCLEGFVMQGENYVVSGR